MAETLSFIVGLGAGYVLGARSGRARYDQIVAKAQEIWQDPRVQEMADQALKDKASSSGSAEDLSRHRSSEVASGATGGTTS